MGQISDVYLVNTLDGGDFVLQGNDLKMVNGFENMVYVALFGGNPNHVTTGPKNTEQSFDYWGNFMLNPSEQRVWFNSTLEYLIENTALSSSSRIEIEQSVLNDLAFMNDFATVSATVELPGIDKVKISIEIIQKGSLDVYEFSYIWNQTNMEIDTLPTVSTTGSGVALQVLLNYDL